MSWLDTLVEFLDGPQPVRTTAVATMQGFPLVANPNDDQKLQSAKYRVGCIKRYLEQTDNVSPAKMREFQMEMRELALLLVKAGQFSDEDHDNALRLVGIGE